MVHCYDVNSDVIAVWRSGDPPSAMPEGCEPLFREVAANSRVIAVP
jgi:hypothetical protein